jgi:hypothetical protein
LAGTTRTTPLRVWTRGGAGAIVVGMTTDRLRRLFRVQQQLWARHLTSAGASGRQARAVVGEPPLRWSGGRLRGCVLPD